MAHWDSTQGQAKMAKIAPLIVTFPPGNLKPKTKYVFFYVN